MSLRLNLSFLKQISRVTLLAGLAAYCLSAADVERKTGVLLDRDSAPKAELRIVEGPRLEGGMVWAYTYTRDEALKPESQRTGYGIYTYDQGFLAFDPAGNQKALALLRSTKKTDDLRIEVVGEIAGKTIKVSQIKFL
jgi:hypothetical protein